MKLTGKFEIKSPEVITETINGKSGPFDVFFQWGYGNFGDEVRKFKVQRKNAGDSLKAGTYQSDTLAQVSQYGVLALPRDLTVKAS